MVYKTIKTWAGNHWGFETFEVCRDMVHNEWKREQGFRKVRSLELWKEGRALLGSATPKSSQIQSKTRFKLQPFPAIKEKRPMTFIFWMRSLNCQVRGKHVHLQAIMHPFFSPVRTTEQIPPKLFDRSYDAEDMLLPKHTFCLILSAWLRKGHLHVHSALH